MRPLVALTMFVLLCAPCAAQDFLVDWVQPGRPDGQISVNTTTGVWDDFAEGGGSGSVEVDGNDLVLKDRFGRTVAVLKDAKGAKTGAEGKVERGTQSIGQWECVEF